MIPKNITATGNSLTNVPFPPNPDLVDFGKAMEISAALIDDPVSVTAFYDMVLKDYFKGKAEHFPTWSGLPKIVVSEGVDPLKRSVSIGWYVQVPRAHAVDPDQKEEDTLWDS